MTTYVICDNCGNKLKSPIQLENLDNNIIQGNRTICPACNQTTLVENRNMFNK